MSLRKNPKREKHSLLAIVILTVNLPSGANPPEKTAKCQSLMVLAKGDTTVCSNKECK